MSIIPAIRIKAAKPTASIIFIHGLGDSGQGWSFLPEIIRGSGIISNSNEINFVFPNAPTIPITANQGYAMPGWFDIFEFGNINAKQDLKGFLNSIETIKSLINEQIELGINPSRIIIGGFSQGAALALATGALSPVKLGGIIGLSGFCPISSHIEKSFSSANLATPFFQGHGTVDPMVNFSVGKESSEFYKKIGFTNYTFNSYPGVAHSADEKELNDVQVFINDVLKKN